MYFLLQFKSLSFSSISRICFLQIFDPPFYAGIGSVASQITVLSAQPQFNTEYWLVNSNAIINVRYLTTVRLRSKLKAQNNPRWWLPVKLRKRIKVCSSWGRDFVLCLTHDSSVWITAVIRRKHLQGAASLPDPASITSSVCHQNEQLTLVGTNALRRFLSVVIACHCVK